MDKVFLPPKTLLLGRLGLGPDAEIEDVNRRYNSLVAKLEYESQPDIGDPDIRDCLHSINGLTECYMLLLEDRYWKEIPVIPAILNLNVEEFLCQHGLQDLVHIVGEESVDIIERIDKNNREEYGLSLVMCLRLDLAFARVSSSKEAVTILLSELGLSRYADNFHTNEVGIDSISLLNEEDLISLGVLSRQDRQLVLASCSAPLKFSLGTQCQDQGLPIRTSELKLEKQYSSDLELFQEPEITSMEALTCSAGLLLRGTSILADRRDGFDKNLITTEICSDVMATLALPETLREWCKSVLHNTELSDERDKSRTSLRQLAENVLDQVNNDVKTDFSVGLVVQDQEALEPTPNTHSNPFTCQAASPVNMKDQLFTKHAEPWRDGHTLYLKEEIPGLPVELHCQHTDHADKGQFGLATESSWPGKNLEAEEHKSQWASRAARVRLQTAAIAQEAARLRSYQLLVLKRKKRNSRLGLTLQKTALGTFVVTEVVEGEIAFASGQIEIDDEVRSIDGHQIEGMPSEVVESLLLGDQRAWVAIVILPNSCSSTFPRNLDRKTNVGVEWPISANTKEIKPSRKFWWCTPCETLDIRSYGHVIQVKINGVVGKLSNLAVPCGTVISCEVQVVSSNSSPPIVRKGIDPLGVWGAEQLVGAGNSKISIGTRVVLAHNPIHEDTRLGDIGTICELESQGLTCRVRWDSGIVSLHDTGCQDCFELARLAKATQLIISEEQIPTPPVLMDVHETSNRALQFCLASERKLVGVAILPLFDLQLGADVPVVKEILIQGNNHQIQEQSDDAFLEVEIVLKI